MRTANSRARSRRTSAFLLSAVVAVAALGAAACSGGSSSTTTTTGATATAHGPLEQTHLRIGVPKDELGGLPIFTGVDKGYFKDQGIDLTVDDSFPTYQAALKALGDGKVDVVYDDYVHAILAQSTGLYRLQLVAEGYTAGDGSVQLLSKRTDDRSEAKIRSVFNTPAGFLTPMAGTGDPDTEYTVPTVMLMTRLPDVANSLKVRGDATGQAHLKPMTVGAIGDKLAGSPDSNLAAVEPEPYLSNTTGNNQVVKLMDLTRGSTQAMPMGGYFAKQEFAVNDTNLLKAFTAALNQAKSVTGQRATAMAEMQAHYSDKASATVVANISFGSFPTTVSVARVGRVVTLMQDLGLAPYYNIDTMMPPDAKRGQD